MMASRALCTPTMPSDGQAGTDLDTGHGPSTEEHEGDGPGAVDQHHLERRRVVERRDPDRSDPPGHRDPPAPAGLDDRDRAATGPARGRRRPNRCRSAGSAPARPRTATSRSRPVPRGDLDAGAEVERDDGDVGVGEVRHLLLDRVTGAVVEDAVPDPLVLPLGEEHRHLGLTIGQLPGDALHRGAGEPTVRAGHQLERDPLEPELAPLLRELRGVGVVDRRSGRRAARRA